jgi:Fe-S-cluster-containing hydrogenase component 2
MKFEVNKSKCAGCGACLRACPHGAIEIGKDGKAFIDQNKCKKCGECQRICPFDAIEEISGKGDKKNINQATISSPAQIPDDSFGRGRGFGMGRGMGRGLGRGPRDGRGGGRGGGGKLFYR